MAAQRKAKVVEIVSLNKCEHCKRTFSAEKTLLAHACEQKNRWLAKDDKHVRIGLIAFQKFYQLSMRVKKIKSYDDFMSSSYYVGFCRFGKHVININAIEPEGFIEYLIKMQVKLPDWCSDGWYEAWVRELAKKEDPMKAIERNILLMEAWALDSGETWQEFFRKVPPALATKWIRSGRISPWLLYARGVGEQLFTRMSDEQLVLVKEWINPLFWFDKIKTHKDDMQTIETILKEAGV